MVLANTQCPGMDFAFPDVCKIPPLAIPAPFPNLAPLVVGEPTQFEVLIECMPAHNLMTIKMITQGDDAGLMGGLISQVDMAISENIEFVTNVLMGGPPATKMLNATLQNLINAPGMTLVPSQVTVIMLQ